MPTQIQLRRGTTSEHSSFTGAAGEVTVDTTKKALVVHDGSTAGGIPVAKENNATLTGSVTLPGTSVFNSTGLGIGTSSPVSKLQSVSAVSALTSNAGFSSLPVTVSDSTALAADTGGGINFNAIVTAGGVYNSIAAIKAGRSIATGFDYRGYLSFYTGSNATGHPVENMRLDASGNLGLGVTPSSMNTINAMQLGYSGIIAGQQGTAEVFYLGSNWYYNSGFKYKNNGYASRYNTDAGSHSWYTAASGTAGNAISFTQAMTLDASGNLGVGSTSISPAYGYSKVIEVAGSFPGIKFAPSGSSTFGFQIGAGTGGFQFYDVTAATERARIDSSGNLLVGTQTQPSGASARQVVKYGTSDYVSYFWNSNASPYGVRVQHDTDTNGTGNQFLMCVGNATERASIRSNGGIANYQANDVNLSDRREKTNFAPAKSYLDTICAIPVQTFNYIDQSEDDPGLTLGVVAQDVQAVAPELVMESNWGTEDNPKMRLSIYQTDLQYALMKCIQELKAEVDSLKAQLKGA